MRITDVRIDFSIRDNNHGSFRPIGLIEDLWAEDCEVQIVLKCSREEATAIYNMRGRPVCVQEGPPQLPERAEPEIVECRVDEGKALPPKSTIP